MAISFVNQSQAGTNSITLPASIAAGDFIVLFGYRNTTTAPSLASGYTNIANQSANSNSGRAMYKIAAGTESGTSVTVTNANVIQCAVYRGVSRIGGAGSTTNASASTTTLSGIGTMQLADSSSWAVVFGGSAQTTSMSTPSGTTLRGTTQTGTTSTALICDSNAGVASWAQHTSTNGTNAVGMGGSVELVAVGAGTSTLTDLFDQLTLGSPWTQVTGGSATMAYATTGATVTFPASATSATVGSITSKSAFSLIADSAYLYILVAPSAITSADGEFRIQINATNWVRWVIEGGTLFAQYDVAGVKNTPFSVTHSLVTHAAVRFTESAGTLSWDTWDGSTWTNRATVANPITLTALQYFIAGSCFQAETAPGVYKWNNLNTTGSTSASITQVAATVTAAGGTQAIATVNNVSISQVAATLTAAGGTQVVQTATSISQIAATLTVTGGLQTVATVNIVSLTQLAATVTAAGGTQTVATVNNVSISQLAATLTAAGGTQAVSAVVIASASITQVAATITATGGVQVIDSINIVSVSQVAANLTVAGGTQSIETVNIVEIVQEVASLAASGGTQTVDAVSNSAITQIAATAIANGGSQSIETVNNVAIAQQSVALIISGGIQEVMGTSGMSDASIDQVGASLVLTGGSQIISTSTGPLLGKKYYIDSDGNIYWVVNQSIRLLEKL